MTTRRYRYDADLDAVVEIGNYFEERPRGPNVIGDDIGAGVKGLRHMASNKFFDSKSRFRQETKDRGLAEVGNEQNFASAKVSHGRRDYERMAKDAYDQFSSNYGGIADRIKSGR